MPMPEFNNGYIKPTEWGLSLFTVDDDLVASIGRNREPRELVELAEKLDLHLPVSPYTAPERFTEEEKEIFERGECMWQTGYGLPWTEHCGKPSKKNADFGHCAEHEGELKRGY